MGPGWTGKRMEAVDGADGSLQDELSSVTHSHILTRRRRRRPLPRSSIGRPSSGGEDGTGLLSFWASEPIWASSGRTRTRANDGCLAVVVVVAEVVVAVAVRAGCCDGLPCCSGKGGRGEVAMGREKQRDGAAGGPYLLCC